MPVFFQQQINEYTRLGVWKIEETEEYFRGNVPLHRDVTHPHKRLQHLAGRFLLQFLYPDFPYELVQIADTKKPFLPEEQYHFSISHCGDFAAAIVSSRQRVGVDVEIPGSKILKIIDKFLSQQEKEIFNIQQTIFNAQVEKHLNAKSTKSYDTPIPNSEFQILNSQLQIPTLLWSAKEAAFKWYGQGAVDFKEHIQLLEKDEKIIECNFVKTTTRLQIHYRNFEQVVLAWVVSG